MSDKKHYIIPRKRKKQIVRRPKQRGGNIGLLLNAIPNDIKRQLATQLVKDLTLKVALPIASVVGAKKLYNKHKKK